MSVENLKILVCDDSLFVRKKITNVLRNCGVTELYEAADGEQAVEMYNKYAPDLVLMDIVMPRMSGVEALKLILADDPKAKVVMASSVGTQENLKEAINAGAFDFLQKPISDTQLETLVRKVGK
ncbi:MAG: response regulator [Oscillospiraceae bacterium]|nr:response regulator [Oscillospiraceae bacterium]